ncbi:MAG: lamin tail domain-containing protein [Candidatus Staskawiczbacteria bacterium]|nr:lamin tail domain-containing protein [Candidatus Staskawiczbacteria bacterium]
MRKILFILFFILLICPNFVFATSLFDVVINEIAWMGTANSANDEWIELKNNTGGPIDLSNWTLQTADEKIVVKLTGTISANGFYLLERTDDTTLPNFTADQIYTGSLSNNGQDLWLYDTSNNIIDEADFYQGWTFGDNATKQTMERVGSTAWQTSEASGGTPKSGNSVAASGQAPQPENSPEPTTNYPNGIFINEILPNPEGSDETEEWFELFNSNNFDVDLAGWKIQDIVGTQTTYVPPKNTVILAGGFLVFKRPDTKIVLNNDEDGLTLFSPDEKIVDTANYTKSPLKQSYSKAGLSWQWSVAQTPGATNSISSATAKPKSEGLSNSEKSDKNSVAEAGLANISQSINFKQKNTENPNPWFLFFTALAVTIISAVTVLFIKLKVFRKHVRT